MIALSRNPVILGSHKEILWSTLSALQSGYALEALTGESGAVQSVDIPPLLSLGKRRLREPRELLDLLRLGRKCEATDPRDRVFALLGLLIGAEAEGLVADYTQTTSQVFTWIARYLANKGALVDVLGNLNDFPMGSEDTVGSLAQLPSWVPDWRSSKPTFLARFPHAKVYLDSIPLEFDDSDTSALRLTGFNFGDLTDPPYLVGTILEIRLFSLSQRPIMFQIMSQAIDRHGSIASGGRFLMILAPVSIEDAKSPELPDLKEFEVWSGTFVGSRDRMGEQRAFAVRSDTVFRFLGLLQLKHDEGQLYRSYDRTGSGELTGYERSALSIKII